MRLKSLLLGLAVLVAGAASFFAVLTLAPDGRAVKVPGLTNVALKKAASPRPSANLSSATNAARAICQPPQTMPISLRNGTAPANAARGSVPAVATM